MTEAKERNSVVAVSTATGTSDGTQRFDAWGNKTTVTGAAVATFGYTGREPDASGLTYYRARYYDPASRRFTQRDPIGFGGGLNQYAYVGNNPVNFTDPSGLLPTGPSNSNGTSYPGNGSSGCLSQLTPGEEQTATDAVAEVEGIDFSHGPVVVAGPLQCLRAPGMLGAGLPGYQGLQQQNQDPGGYEAALGLTPSTPPSMAQQIGNAIGGFVNGAIDSAFNLGNLIFRNDSRELGRNLEADGFNRQTGTAAHHIVPSGSNNPNAVEARNRLQGFGIDINSAANGVFLPTTPESQAPGAYHPSLHTDRYYNSVNKALGRATNTQEALDALSGIRGKLLNNQF